ncbi:Site-specific recombinase XerD [Nitrosomonas aestuarii]|uniref:Site-specific recombinase XerD n=1 Tax=Nitrosomonas aestuarii TaxID=52441 RepID=A0A1I4BAH4_9PROT|nr:site-specific integrase [Nitrosomonas aestuarii]SFK64991.1 Site-specific recombinase XerD [Nitrosomonas aestuarii]
MHKHHPDNERIKHRYFSFLKEAMRQSEQTIDGVAKAIARFEEFNKYRDFKLFHHQQAIAFKKYLPRQLNKHTGKKLSKATMHSTMTNLKKFFEWLAREPGYKSRLRYTDAEYFNISSKDMRIATARRKKTAPTVEQIKHVIKLMPNDTDIERRNKALVAFTLLTGARDGALASIKLKHVNLLDNSVFQDARDVSTKFSKTFTTYFFPVGGNIRQIVADWINYLKEQKLWGNDDPLFPMTEIGLNENRQFGAIGLKRKHWSTTAPIRGIFKKAFVNAGLAYFNPHSFRKTLVNLGEVICKTPEDFKAWSQNLGHEGVMTTFLSYGQVAEHRQSEILKQLAVPQQSARTDINELAKLMMQQLRNTGIQI